MSRARSWRPCVEPLPCSRITSRHFSLPSMAPNFSAAASKFSRRTDMTFVTWRIVQSLLETSQSQTFSPGLPPRRIEAMSQPLVSVIIPCFNAAPWLAGTIESALSQTWPRTEIIIIDDGSTDQSVAVARQFESGRVRLLSQENAGAGMARNAGIAIAQGDFMQYLDADDR